MRGEACQFLATILSAAAVILALFVHIGQVSTSVVPRGISMVKINTSEYASVSVFPSLLILFYSFNHLILVGHRDTLSAISTNVDDFSDIYTNDSSAPLNERQGLRELYLFGLYSHCAYTNSTAGICSSQTVGVSFHPYDDLTGDMPLRHSTITDALLVGPIRQSSYLGALTKAAYWLILFGTIFAFVACVTGWRKKNTTFIISTSAALAGTLLLLTAAAIWTDVARRIEVINSQTVGNDIPIGLQASAGIGVYLLWGAFAALFLSTVPYLLVCCTWRG